LIGPNGAGKSTLLEILRSVDPDTASRCTQTRKLSYVLQDSQFASGETVRSVLKRALDATRFMKTTTVRVRGNLGARGI